MSEFLRQGCRSAAYTSIVGTGKNSCVLHYVENSTEIKNGDVVLIDAGGEYQYYASDLTRTFPANGRFSAEQKAVYNLVLKAQLAGINMVRPGTYWPKIQEVIIDTITRGLVELGLLHGKPEDLIEKKAYQQFYMHNSGHWLGIDVHDVGSYKVNGEWRTLQPGMVLTVEPGIYIAPNSPNVDKKWWGIGIRIEDDVLVTKNGNEVLSADLPKQIDEIEALMAK
jgi:Xaa-Pro aminopeptidase